MTKAKQSGSFKGHRFPSDVIAYAVWAYFRFPMSLRDVEDLLAERGIIVSYETVRALAAKFGERYAKAIRRDRPAPSDKWHLDEVVITIRGKKHWLWRAVDANGDVLDILVQSRRNKAAADWFFRKLFKQYGLPRVVITDKLRSYGVALKALHPASTTEVTKVSTIGRRVRTGLPSTRKDYGPVQVTASGTTFSRYPRSGSNRFSPPSSHPLYHHARFDAHAIWDDITRELGVA